MKSNKLFKFIEYSLNMAQKFFSQPKKINLIYQINKNKITIVSLFFFCIILTTFLIYQAITQKILIIQIVFSLLSAIAASLSILVIGNLIVTYNPEFPFNLKIYGYNNINDEIIKKESVLPLLKKLRKKKETEDDEFKEESGLSLVKNLGKKKETEDNEFKETEIKIENLNFSNTISNHTEYNFTNIQINDSFNTVVSDITNDKKEENSSTNQKHNEDLNIQCLSLDSEINYANRPINTSGPGGDYYKYFALKYYLIQQFYPEEKIDTQKYKSQEDFLNKIGKLENINPGSLKTWYIRINKEPSFTRVLKTYPRLIILLHRNNELKTYPQADNCAKKLILSE